MLRIKGNTIVAGNAAGLAMITSEPVNFTAAFTKVKNVLPFARSQFRDAHHPWFGQDMHGKILFFPTCIGSTYTGLVLLDLVRLGLGPAGLVVEQPDPLLVSGIILSQVWYDRSIPVIQAAITEEQAGQLEGKNVQIIGGSGEIIPSF